jgi:tripartite-type tricarboxylate transporter receptor subunit TctC
MKRALVFVVLGIFSCLAAGQPFPSKTIRLVSGVTPGSASDTMARVLSEKLAASLGQPVIVENRLGAGGVVAAKYVASAEPDGHTISIYTSAFTIAPILNPGSIDPRELTGVATLGVVPTVMVVTAGKYKTLAEVVSAAKAKPGQLVATNAGIGSSTHMNLERFRLSAGLEFLNLPMKGPSEALTEVITGRADLYFAPVFAVQAHVKDGRLVPLAVGSAKRSALFPDLPTTVEAGYPNSDYNFWIGALVSAKTPRPLVERLNREFNAALQQADVKDRMAKLGVDPLNLSIDEFNAMLGKELSDNAELVKRAGIKLVN